MADLSTSAAELRRVVNFFQGLSAAADFLDDSAKLQSMAEANEKRQKEAQALLDETNSQLAKAKKGIAEAKEKAAAIVASAEAGAMATADIANGAAKDILAAAEKDAEAARSAARASVAEITSGLTGQIEQLTKDRDALDDQVFGLNSGIEAKTKEVEALEARLAKAQASIAKLLG